jgi:hypothetical protein
MRVTLGLALTCLVVACGSDNGPPSISTSKDNVCDQIAAVACYDMYQCCSEGEIERDLQVGDPRTEDQCRDDVLKRCERLIAPINASLKAGRVTFNSGNMNTCLKSLIAPSNECATVSDKLPWTDACMMTAWVGAVAVGGQCYYTYECAGDGTAYCAPNETCTALPTDGQPCSAQGCAQGFFCNFQNDQCRALLGNGGTCTANNQCMKGLFCDFQTGAGTCQPLHNGGEACTSSASCVSNQCLPGMCMRSAGTCYTDLNCGRYCSAGPLMGQFCNVDSQCEGHCSTTTTQICTSNLSCPQGPPAETCVFNTCVSDTCVGDIVCANAQITVDYCTGAVGALPL